MHPYYFDIIKTIDFSEMDNNVVINDELMTIKADREELLWYLNDYIAMHGLEGEEYRCTEYGKKLYQLYDYLCFDYFDQ